MAINKQDKIKVKNISTGIVGYSSTNFKVTRNWNSPNSVLQIPFEEIEDALFNELGVRELFTGGWLYMEDKEARVLLGLEEEIKDIVFDTNQMLTLLKGTASKLSEAMSKMPRASAEKMAHLAAEHNITTIDKVRVIQKFSGINIITLIEMQQDLNKSGDKK